ncbi:MAG: acyltransferase family protein, partial [Gammaproteobacteria bacterium]
PQHLERFGGALVYAAGSLSNFYFWGESDYFGAAARFKPLLHTWSLSVEEQFYLVWPALLVFIVAKLPRRAAFTLVLLIAIVSASGSHWMLSRDATAAFYLMPFRLFELAIGALLVWLGPWQPRERRWLDLVAAAGLGLIGYAVFAFDEGTPFPGLNALLPCIGAALVIAAGEAPHTGALLRNAAAVRLGLISYSLYLIHWPVLVFYQYYTYQDPGHLERLALVAVSIVAAELMYRGVERPLRYGRKDDAQWSPAAFGLGCALTALVLVVPAATAWARDGWAWRLPSTSPPAELVHEYRADRPAWAEREPVFTERFANLVTVGSRAADARLALLLGDSHANQLAPLADFLGKRHGVRFFIYSGFGCPPLFGTWKIYAINDTATGRDREQACRQQVERWRELVSERRFDYVGLAARWAWLYEGDRYGPYRMREDYLVVDSDTPLEREASRAVFRRQLKSTIDAIRATGAEVLLFSQVPHQGKTLDDCSSVPGYIVSRESIGARCGGIDRELALARLAFTDDYLAAAAGDGVHAVVPSRYFCPPDRNQCTAFVGRTSLYQNNNHINTYGAIYYARRWEADPDFPLAASPRGEAAAAR